MRLLPEENIQFSDQNFFEFDNFFLPSIRVCLQLEFWKGRL
jgi:hypothetical protein